MANELAIMNRRNQLILDVWDMSLHDWSVLEYASLNLEREIDARLNRWLASADQVSVETILDLLYDPPNPTETGMTMEEFRSTLSELLGLLAMQMPEELTPRIGALMDDERIQRSIIDAFTYIENHDTLPWLMPAVNKVKDLSEDEQVHLVLAIMNNIEPKRMLILQILEDSIPETSLRAHNAIREYREMVERNNALR